MLDSFFKKEKGLDITTSMIDPAKKYGVEAVICQLWLLFKEFVHLLYDDIVGCKQLSVLQQIGDTYVTVERSFDLN